MLSFQTTLNGRNAMRISNCSIAGFRITVLKGTGTVATTSFNNINLICQLNRRSTNTTVFSGFVPVMARAVDVSSNEGLPLDGYYCWSIRFPKGIVINLKGDDEMVITMNTGALMQTSGPAEITYTCLCESIQGVGIEYYTPRMSIFAMPNNTANFSMPMNDFMSSLTAIMSKDKCQDLNISSDKWMDSLNLYSFRNMLMEQYPYQGAQFVPIDGSVCIYNGFPLRNVLITGTIDTVDTTILYLVAWGGITNPDVKARSMALKQKITNENKAIMPGLYC